MPRRKGAHRGSFRRGLSRGFEKGFVKTSSFSPPGNHKGLTLAEEALNTERHQSHWESGSRLRHSKVNFISAGNLSNNEPKDTESALAHLSLDSPPRDPQEAVPVNVEFEPEEEKDATASPFIIDAVGDKSISTLLPPPRICAPSPTPSSSSEEILFGGRNPTRKAITRNVRSTKPSLSTDSYDAKIKDLDDKIQLQEGLLEGKLHRELSSPPSREELMTNHSDGFETVISMPKNRDRDSGRRRHRGAENAAEKEAVLADYLVNMDSEYREVLGHGFGVDARELGGTEDEILQDETGISAGDLCASLDRSKSRWDASSVEHLVDLNISDAVDGEGQDIFSRRESDSRLQYLVVWANQIMDDAESVPARTLTNFGAQAHVKGFEVGKKFVAQIEAVSEDGDDNEDDSLNGENTADDRDEEEEVLLQPEIESIDDEQIARTLAKQELCMGANELLLFDDAADADEEGEYIVPNRSFNAFLLPQGKIPPSKRPPRDCPDATALADSCDGFDVMEFERPSLLKRPKVRKGKLISDDVDASELEEAMQAAWENDRVKKKERKQERERLRAQGLLGSNNGKVDLKQKYKEGMNMEAIKNEIKRFLISSDTTLALSPMDKASRKIVHEIANNFNLKSKSAGHGNSRFPVLYRTNRSSAFIERTWGQVEARIMKRYLPRTDLSGTKGAKPQGSKKITRAGGIGFNRAVVSYRDGDVVGGSAPELGAENRGRAMLEKMGWSQGTALGAANNKGILQPVSHVVKTTKAGLG